MAYAALPPVGRSRKSERICAQPDVADRMAEPPLSCIDAKPPMTTAASPQLMSTSSHRASHADDGRQEGAATTCSHSRPTHTATYKVSVKQRVLRQEDRAVAELASPERPVGYAVRLRATSTAFRPLQHWPCGQAAQPHGTRGQVSVTDESGIARHGAWVSVQSERDTQGFVHARATCTEGES